MTASTSGAILSQTLDKPQILALLLCLIFPDRRLLLGCTFSPKLWVAEMLTCLLMDFIMYVSKPRWLAIPLGLHLLCTVWFQFMFKRKPHCSLSYHHSTVASKCLSQFFFSFITIHTLNNDAYNYWSLKTFITEAPMFFYSVWHGELITHYCHPLAWHAYASVFVLASSDGEKNI